MKFIWNWTQMHR